MGSPLEPYETDHLGRANSRSVVRTVVAERRVCASRFATVSGSAIYHFKSGIWTAACRTRRAIGDPRRVGRLYYESEGRAFESLRARHFFKGLATLPLPRKGSHTPYAVWTPGWGSCIWLTKPSITRFSAASCTSTVGRTASAGSVPGSVPRTSTGRTIGSRPEPTASKAGFLLVGRAPAGALGGCRMSDTPAFGAKVVRGSGRERVDPRNRRRGCPPKSQGRRAAGDWLRQPASDSARLRAFRVERRPAKASAESRSAARVTRVLRSRSGDTGAPVFCSGGERSESGGVRAGGCRRQ